MFFFIARKVVLCGNEKDFHHVRFLEHRKAMASLNLAVCNLVFAGLVDSGPLGGYVLHSHMRFNWSDCRLGVRGALDQTSRVVSETGKNRYF